MQSRSLALFRSIILRSRPVAGNCSSWLHKSSSERRPPVTHTNPCKISLCDDDYSASGHWNILPSSSNKTGAARLLISTHPTHSSDGNNSSIVCWLQISTAHATSWLYGWACIERRLWCSYSKLITLLISSKQKPSNLERFCDFPFRKADELRD